MDKKTKMFIKNVVIPDLKEQKKRAKHRRKMLEQLRGKRK